MRIIFLDIDGVLNHELYYRRTRLERKGRVLKKRPVEIDEGSVAQLNELIRQTEAKVVVTSAWRHDTTPSKLQAQFESKGFQGQILDFTPDYRGLPGYFLRGNEVEGWRDKHKLRNCREYVILDDDSDYLLWHRHNFIRVDQYCGLTPNNVFAAAKIILEGRPFIGGVSVTYDN